MDRRKHALLILLCLAIYSLLPLFPYVEVQSNYTVWFCVLYFITSYIRLYKIGILDKYSGELAFLSFFLASTSIWLSLVVGLKWPYYLVIDAHKILALLVSICSFVYFKKLKIRQSRFINAFGSATFGVLLIHDSSFTMRGWLWKDFLHVKSWYDGNIYFYSMTCVLCVFALCAILDMIRLHLLEEPLFRSARGQKL